MYKPNVFSLQNYLIASFLRVKLMDLILSNFLNYCALNYVEQMGQKEIELVLQIYLFVHASIVHARMRAAVYTSTLRDIIIQIRVFDRIHHRRRYASENGFVGHVFLDSQQSVITSGASKTLSCELRQSENKLPHIKVYEQVRK